jgi:hypothetical protein
MKKVNVIKIFLGVLFLSNSFFNYLHYLDYKSSITNNKPISYTFIENKIHEGGRGKYYDMVIKYNNNESVINITSKELDLIELGKYPELYFSKNSGIIFSKWEIKKAIRITILFFLLSIIALIPWNFLKLNKS